MLKSRILTSLIAVNAIGVAALAVVSFTPSVTGQDVVRADRFIAVVGESRSKVSSEIVYVTDTNTNRMIAIEYDSGNEEIVVVGHRDINRDLKEIARSKPRTSR